MILVDTSVWVVHLRGALDALTAELDRGTVLMHPFVIGELACGNLKNRAEILGLLSELPMASTATDDEVLGFIEARKLMDRGIGFFDAHLLAATALTPSARLWTADTRLHKVATELGPAHLPA